MALLYSLAQDEATFHTGREVELLHRDRGSLQLLLMFAQLISSTFEYRSSSVPSSTMFDYSNVLGLFMAFPHFLHVSKQFRTCKKNLLSFPLFPLPLCVSGLQAAACIGSSEQLHCLESSPSILFGSLSSC